MIEIKKVKNEKNEEDEEWRRRRRKEKIKSMNISTKEKWVPCFRFDKIVIL